MKGYLFDMDGVLVLSTPTLMKAVQMVLAPFGAQPKAEDFVPYFGAGEDKFISGVAEKYGVSYTQKMKEDVLKTYYRLIETAGLKVHDGAKEVLLALRKRGARIALASSADREKVQANLKAGGIRKSDFDAIVTGEDVARKKPAPDIFVKAAEALGLAPSECLVIEDAPSGVQAAKKAGAKCAAYVGSFSKESLQQEAPDYVIESLLTILEL